MIATASSRISNSEDSVTCTTFTYYATVNHDPDGHSHGTRIAVFKAVDQGYKVEPVALASGGQGQVNTSSRVRAFVLNSPGYSNARTILAAFQ